MTAQEIADCRTDLFTFTKVMFKARKGIAFSENWHQEKICTSLERVVIGKTKRLIITIPPRSGKTELAVINFIAWCMGNFPESEFIHASYSKRLATNNTYHARALIQHDKYAEIFGAPKFRGDSNAKDEFRTQQGGVVYATGAEGTITGYGAGGMGERFKGAIVIDDPHKAGEGNSETMRENVLDWFSTTMESRKNSPDTPIIIIMQRLHKRDLAGFLLDGGNGEEWEHLNIPAITEGGVSFWKKQFPLDDLRRMEKANRYRFAGQYMQSPAPIGGGIFRDEWWQFYSVTPRIKYRMIYADTAQKTKEQNDYSVFQCWGKGSDGKIYLLDMIRGKWESPQLLRAARAFWDKHKALNRKTHGTLRKLKPEDKSSGTGLIQQLQQQGVPVEGIQRSIDKVTRAMDAAPQIQAGNVMLPESAPYVSDILSEATGFPNAAHDDTLDPLMDAIDDMLTSDTTFDYSRLL
jgi:predicted phage terminase large subunit-like protein